MPGKIHRHPVCRSLEWRKHGMDEIGTLRHKSVEAKPAFVGFKIEIEGVGTIENTIIDEPSPF